MLWNRIRLQVVAISAVVSWLGGSFLLDSWLSGAPFDQPISLASPSYLQSEIFIPLRENYELQLEFNRTGHSFEELQTLIGRWFPKETAGVPVQIMWSLLKGKGHMLVAGATVVAKGSSGWGSGVVYRAVAHLQVAPGRYTLIAQVISPAPELAELSPHLTLSFDWKSSTTWQMAAMFWVGIANTFVVLPVFVLQVLWLIGSVVLTTRSSRPTTPRARSAADLDR